MPKDLGDLSVVSDSSEHPDCAEAFRVSGKDKGKGKSKEPEPEEARHVCMWIAGATKPRSTFPRSFTREARHV